MDTTDVIVIAVLLAILVIIVYVTRPKKGEDSGCDSCHSDCLSYSAFFSLYEGHKKDQEQG